MIFHECPGEDIAMGRYVIMFSEKLMQETVGILTHPWTILDLPEGKHGVLQLKAQVTENVVAFLPPLS